MSNERVGFPRRLPFGDYRVQSAPMVDSLIPKAVRWSFVICYLSFFMGLSGCVASDDAWNRIGETRALRVGMDASFPPFEFISADGTLAGFDVDLARELGRRLGVEVRFVVNLPTDGLYDALALGAGGERPGVDLVISALVVNPARMADVAYAPYFDAGQMLVVRSDETSVEAMADLGGRTLAVEFGSRGDQEARKWARRLAELEVLSRQTAAEALVAVEAGEADAALVDYVSALQFGTDGGLVVVGTPVVSEPYAVAVSKDSPRLLRAVEGALAEMETDGTMDALVVRWLKADR
jgi:ABC-type amino acid transport substrate-binding protein